MSDLGLREAERAFAADPSPAARERLMLEEARAGRPKRLWADLAAALEGVRAKRIDGILDRIGETLPIFPADGPLLFGSLPVVAFGRLYCLRDDGRLLEWRVPADERFPGGAAYRRWDEIPE